jgi:hypothetical protein
MSSCVAAPGGGLGAVAFGAVALPGAVPFAGGVVLPAGAVPFVGGALGLPAGEVVFVCGAPCGAVGALGVLGVLGAPGVAVTVPGGALLLW